MNDKNLGNSENGEQQWLDIYLFNKIYMTTQLTLDNVIKISKSLRNTILFCPQKLTF